MIQYAPGPEHDKLLLQWWAELGSLGELESLFGQRAYTLSSFYRNVAPPEHLLLFDCDEQGIFLSFGLDTVLSGAFVSLWVHPRKRQSKSLIWTVRRCYEGAFMQFPVLLGVTRQEHLLASHRRWGYTVVGSIPQLWDGHEAWLVSITREQYDQARRRFRHGRSPNENTDAAGVARPPERRADDPPADGPRPEGTPRADP